MSAPPEENAESLFPNWFGETRNGQNEFWLNPLDFNQQPSLERLVKCLQDDIEAYWNETPEVFSRFASSVISNLPDPKDEDSDRSITFVRYWISSAALRQTVANGRSSTAYNWLLCSISDRKFEDIEPGVPVEVTYEIGRPISYLLSKNVVVSGYAPLIVLRWFADLYYSAWKYSLCHDVAKLMLADARYAITSSVKAHESDLISEAVHAAIQLGSWLNQTNDPEAEAIAKFLATAFERLDWPASARKLAGTALGTQIGRHTSEGSAAWATRTLEEFSAELTIHEECQMLGHACATPEDLMRRFEELLSAYERFSIELSDNYGDDQAGATFRRAQLFDIIAPSLVVLMGIGRCKEIIELVAAWFGVSAEHRRRSPVLVMAPGYEKGMLFAVDDHGELLERDTDASLKAMINAINTAYDKSIVLRSDRELPPATTGRPPRRIHRDELAKAASEFYSLDALGEFLEKAPTMPTGCFHLHAEHTPFQPLTETTLGITWPLITSFEEPQPDRPLKKVLLLSCGTILGAPEVRSVAAFFSAKGTDCVVVADKEISREEFLGFYCDETFDAIWLAGHGEYDSREPHRAHIKLSADGKQIVTVSELLKHTAPDLGRRLLFLNICLGGSTLVTAAPACLGMGAMLANRNQAVVAHLTEVGTFAAPLFGVLMAIGLIESDEFFTAFRFAVRKLPSDHDHALELIRSKAPECGEITERLSRNSPDIEQGDIRTWGTPVFFE